MSGFIITVLLLLGNALFVGSEFALISSRRTALEPRAASSAPARWALTAMGQLPLMIAGAQLGITICSLGLGAVAEPAFAHLLEPLFGNLGVTETLVHPVGLVLALTVVTYLHTVFGEMVPKNISLAGPERCVVWLGPFMLVFCRATYPILTAMTGMSRWILARAGISTSDEAKTVYNTREFAGLVTESRTEGLLDVGEHARMKGALALSDRTAADALHAWADTITVTDDVTPASLELLATRTRRSRFPVVARRTRRLVGFVHVKDIITVADDRRRAPIPPEAIRSLPVMPPETTLAELLMYMRRQAVHIVLISRGSTPLGIVTLDDVLSAVIGNADLASADG
ncbi:MAG TPA: hemolysin family protein [Stackebrandtia sp.]|jgi:CBS domain containing-hemolysin-like protein|uniref:hemolysin family protein n=1 Tax=Stackebrandtia sp. TaxID=2023065 RepID=UPI002D3EA6E2|nr:hemolysin family protein [Stackebrandtia sp.]HZE38724.1 hemolysin family protein [Stackebrandtia sp.]